MNVGRYELLEEVGRGAGGVVHRAVDPTLGRTVAVKLLHAGSDPVSLGRFAREARAAAGVRHRGLVAVLDAGQLPDGRPWLAMEWVQGETLRARLKREGRLPPREAARLGAAVAGGLAEVHAAGLVHRDVKAENILVGVDGAPRLSDFGVVGLRSGGEAGRLTRTGELVGTPAAMAPEQAAGGARVGPEADVWALGVLLHELLSGQSPFARASVLATLEAVLTAPVPPLGADVPAELAAIVLRMLERDPARRGAAGEHAAALAGFVAGEAGRRARVRARRRLDRRVVAGGSVAVALLVAAALTLALARPSAPGPAPGAGAGAAVAAPPAPPAPPAPAAPTETDPAAPAWFGSLAPADRPPVVPQGVRFGEAPGDYVNERDGSVLRWIPPGRFEWRDEAGARPVRLTRGLFLGRDEVSFDQYAAFYAAYYRLPTEGIQPDPYGGPMGQVGWSWAQRYCRWAGGRLPTEAEWLRAACEGGRRYPWGDERRSLGADPREAPGGCAFGLRALGGGVAEWVQDVLAPLGAEELVDPRVGIRGADLVEPVRARRVLRGGAAGLADDARSALNSQRVGVPLGPTTQEEARLFACAGVRLAVDAGPPAFPMPPVMRWRITAWEFPQVPTAPPVPDPPPLDVLVRPGARQLGPVERDDLDLPFGNDAGPGTVLGPDLDPTFPIDSFAIRAEGTVELEPGRYLVHSESDDGIVVWVDGVKVIDRWTHHGLTHDVATLEVDRRRRVELRVDYCELFGGGYLLVELLPD